MQRKAGRPSKYQKKTTQTKGNVDQKQSQQIARISKVLKDELNVSQAIRNVTGILPYYIANTGSTIINCLSVIAAGANENNTRLGNRISLKELNINAWFQVDQKTPGLYDGYISMVVFVDKANVFTDSGTFWEGSGTDMAPNLYPRHDQRARVKVLYQKTYKWDQYNAPIPATGGVKLVTFKKTLYLKGLSAYFDEGGVNCNRNCVKVMFISDNTASSASLSGSCHTRVLYNP